jgi:NAD(P) transhydrogenase subunit alpha
LSAAETSPDERRVAMVPSALSVLNKTGVELLMEPAGAAGFPIPNMSTRRPPAADREEVFGAAEVIFKSVAWARTETGAADLVLLRGPVRTVIGFGEPPTASVLPLSLAERGVTFLSMELMPRALPRPKHGRALLHGDRRRLQRPPSRRRRTAPHVPHR